mgnify:FL=1
MEFYIKKGATLPLLKMQVVKDGRSDYKSFMEDLETSTIYFSMKNVDDGFIKIASASADIVPLILPEGSDPEYYVYFKFTSRDTDEVGRYEGQFLVQNDDGDLILPIRDRLFINIQDSFVEKNECC